MRARAMSPFILYPYQQALDAIIGAFIGLRLTSGPHIHHARVVADASERPENCQRDQPVGDQPHTSRAILGSSQPARPRSRPCSARLRVTELSPNRSGSVICRR